MRRVLKHSMWHHHTPTSILAWPPPPLKKISAPGDFQGNLQRFSKGHATRCLRILLNPSFHQTLQLLFVTPNLQDLVRTFLHREMVVSDTSRETSLIGQDGKIRQRLGQL